MLRRLLKPASASNRASPVIEPLTRAQRAALAHFPNAPLSTMATRAQAWPFPAHLDNPNCKWLQALKHVYAQPVTFPASLSPQAGQLLHAIVLNIQPGIVLETGTFLGISTIWIAAALELAAASGVQGHIHCIDDFRPIKPGRWRTEQIPDGRESRVREHLKLAGIAHRVTLHNADSAAGVSAVAKLIAPRRVQLAFLDADHTPAGVHAEFAALEPALDTGGYVILHDIYPEVSRWRGPRELLDHIHSRAVGRYEQLDLYLAPANFGLGVLRRIG